MPRMKDMMDAAEASEPEAPQAPDPNAAVTMTFAQLLELAKTFSGGGIDAAAIAQIAAEAATQSAKVLRDQWWDEKTDPQKSHFNPLGEKDHPRDEINGLVYWGGHVLQRDQLTQDEIELVNALKPGDFYIRTVSDRDLLIRVINLEPVGSPARRLLVLFPCATQDQRSDLPSMKSMIRQMLGTPVAA